MGRPKDKQYWDKVTKDENGKLKCKKCGLEFSGGVSRIKGHVNRTPRSGISACSIDPDGEGVHNNVASGSGNPQEATNAANSLQENASEPIGNDVGGSINHQNDVESNYLLEEVEDAIDPIGTNNIGGYQNDVQSNYFAQEVEDAPDLVNTNNIGGSINHQNNVEYNILLEGNNIVMGAFDEAINNLNQIISDLQCDEDDIKGQLQLLESQGKKRKRKVDNWLDKLEGFKRRASDMIQSQLLSNIEEFNKEVERYKQQKPLVLSKEIVGEKFEQNFKKVWELLKDDQVFIIGIYGMGGVGKTLLANHVENEIKRKGTFTEVLWVTVSHNFSIPKLQHVIAKKLRIEVDHEDDERTIAATLSSALEAKEKLILILDDVWKYIDLQKVGIPLRVNDIKVVLITRLKHVCQQMDCSPNNMIKIEPLDFGFGRGDDWKFFLMKLGCQGTLVKLSSEVEEIARDVVSMCGDLPLAISLMARTMKGKLDKIDWWKHTLNKLRNGEMGEEMEEEVLKVLELSYDNLVDKHMQNCFLYCVLLPINDKNDLIMKLVEKGLINGMRSLEEIFAEGRTILGKLKDHSLLARSGRILMRHLACYIMKKSDRYAMFRYDLIGTLRQQEWTSDLEMVSLMFIREILGDMSPCCPKLSTLILSAGDITSIPECFFTRMNALTILDLSKNRTLTSLPNSLSSLKSLVSLVLRDCESLEYVPPLGELQALSRLDVSGCALKEVPQGLETLINLKWLDMCSNNGKLTWVSAGSVISGMTNMQYLDLRTSYWDNDAYIEITAEDVQGMNMNILEYFGGNFLNSDIYNQFVRKILNNGFGPKHTNVSFGNIKIYHDWESKSEQMRGLKGKMVYVGDCEEFHDILLPRDLQELNIWGNDQWTCLCNGLSSQGRTSSSFSWKIDIEVCSELKSLFCSMDSCSSCKSSTHHYSTLETIQIRYCHSMKEIFANALQHFSGAFSGLKHIDIERCYAIENLLTVEIVPHLQNLETIRVCDCYSMKEIFAVSNNDEDDGSIIKLPKLTKLELTDLPELKMVWKGIIVCGSSIQSDILIIKDCPELETNHTIFTAQGF